MVFTRPTHRCRRSGPMPARAVQCSALGELRCSPPVSAKPVQPVSPGMVRSRFPCLHFPAIDVAAFRAQEQPHAVVLDPFHALGAGRRRDRLRATSAANGRGPGRRGPSPPFPWPARRGAAAPAGPCPAGLTGRVGQGFRGARHRPPGRTPAPAWPPDPRASGGSTRRARRSDRHSRSRPSIPGDASRPVRPTALRVPTIPEPPSALASGGRGPAAGPGPPRPGWATAGPPRHCAGHRPGAAQARRTARSRPRNDP